MVKANYDDVVELVKSLSAAEQWRLRDWLDVWLEPPRDPPTEEEFDQEMLREGIIDQLPAPIKDLTAFENFKPVPVQGKPVSETIVEERG